MQQARRIAKIGMAVSASLALMKLLVGWQAHSDAVLADGLESAADVFSSALVLVGMTIAARPADENHPYGHGRVDTLSGLLLGFLLLAAGVGIAWHGWTGAAGVSQTPHSWAVWPMLISIAVKCRMVALKHGHARSVGSSSLRADAANDAVDVVSGVVALSALSVAVLMPDRFPHADNYGAFAVGLIVIGTSLRIMYEASLHLMDTMPDDDAMNRIRRVAMTVDNVRGVEKCFARRTGLKYHVDLHLEVDPDITVRASHGIAEEVRNRIKGDLSWVADVLVHVEPWPGRKEDYSPPRPEALS